MRLLFVIAATLFTFALSASAPTTSRAAEHPYGRTSVPPPGPPLDDSTVVTLQRGPCFGKCSEYTVTVYGSGRVEFAGRRYVCTRGYQTAATSPAAIRALVEQMLAFGYLDLYWRAETVPTISPTVISSLQHGGRMRRIEHRTGDPRAPRLLTQLENDIDVVAGSWRWLPEHEDGRRVCRLADGETTEPLEIFTLPR